MRRIASCAVVLVACAETRVQPLPPVVERPPTVEACNGLDDDGDGLVDEGFPDVDEDGVMDCIDKECDLDDLDPIPVDIDPTCPWPGTTPTEPWDLVAQWRWTGLEPDKSVRNVLTAPVVGPLLDTDGDGDIDRDDTPSVAVVAFVAGAGSDGVLVVLDGVSGEVQWTLDGWSGVGSLALGDVDGDGRADLVGYSPVSAVLAVHGDGTPLWAGPRASRSNAPLTALADLDGDGVVEVLADDLILDGRDGTVKAVLQAEEGVYYRGPSAVDLDGDGDFEVVFGGQVFDREGRLLWQAKLTSERGLWPVVLDIDGNDLPEVVVAGRAALETRSGTGELLGHANLLNAAQTGPVCAGDFDGDGAPELAIASQERLCVFEADGRERWCTPVTDRSGLAGCVGYDVNGDGRLDVVYASEKRFAIYDGLYGAERFRDSDHSSATLLEQPVVADIDDDGSAEIVVVSNDAWHGSSAGVVAWSQRDDTLHAAGRVWGQNHFVPGHRRQDGRVARPTTGPSVARARPLTGPEATDLRVTAGQTCAASCADDGVVRVQAQVHNTGGAMTRSGVQVALYARDGADLRLVQTRALTDPVPAGGSSEAVRFRLTVAELGDGLLVRVDDDGTGADAVWECDETDNEAIWIDLPCQ